MKETAPPTPQFLFILHARQGNLSIDDMKLHLNDLDHMVGFFTDRPDRRAGATSLDTFLMEWEKHAKEFEADPPNSALVTLSGKDDYNEVGIELKSPVFEGSTLTFDLSILPGNQWNGPTQFEEVMLFIDDTRLKKHGSDFRDR
ncbi:MAG: hypothetical protein H7A36_07080 [Chlamydiales bacterium]|nr:hypothetical protein [Chlamydiales bacterium]